MPCEADKMTLVELIEAYGDECAAGGAGYTTDDSSDLLEEIKRRIKVAEKDGGGAI